MGTVKFEVSASAAKAVAEILKVVQAEAEMGAAAAGAAKQATAAGIKIEGAYKRAATAAQLSAAAQRKAAAAAAGFNVRAGAGGGAADGAGPGQGGAPGTPGRKNPGPGERAKPAEKGYWDPGPRGQRKDFYDHLETGVDAMQGAFLGIAGLIEARAQHLQVIGDRLTHSIDSSKALLSLGDNLTRAPEIRNNIRDISTNTGLPADQIYSAKFNLESATSAMTPVERTKLFTEAVRMAKVTGGDLAAITTLVAKTMTVYGREAGDAAQTTSLLYQTMSDAAVTMDEMSKMYPDLAASAKAAGIPIKDLDAAIVVATSNLGSADKTGVALRNLILRMNDAVKEGIVPAGTLLQQLEAIAKLPVDTVRKIWGDETLALATAVAAKTKEYREELEKLAKVQKDLLAQREKQMWADPATAGGLLVGSARRGLENDRTGISEDPHQNFEVLKLDLAKRGANALHPTSPDWANDLHARAELAMEGLGADGDLKAGYIKAFNDAKRAGDVNQMNALKLQFGEFSGMKIKLPYERDRFGRPVEKAMGVDDFTDFQRLQRGGLQIDPDQYLEYRQRDALDPKSGSRYLGGLPRSKEGDPLLLPGGVVPMPGSRPGRGAGAGAGAGFGSGSAFGGSGGGGMEQAAVLLAAAAADLKEAANPLKQSAQGLAKVNRNRNSQHE